MALAWLRAFHVISVISWMSGLLYLPRLFVYHAETTDATGHARFCVMERRLFWYITTPAALLSAWFGHLLVAQSPLVLRHQTWLHWKLALVTLLIGFHVSCGVYLRQFAKARCRRSARFFRWFNECPTLLMIAIVILVELKP